MKASAAIPGPPTIWPKSVCTSHSVHGVGLMSSSGFTPASTFRACFAVASSMSTGSGMVCCVMYVSFGLITGSDL